MLIPEKLFDLLAAAGLAAIFIAVVTGAFSYLTMRMRGQAKSDLSAIGDLQRDVDNLTNIVKRVNSTFESAKIAEGEYDALVANVKSKIEEHANSEYLKELETRIKEGLPNQTALAELRRVHIRSIERLESYVGSLTSQNTFSLINGFMVTVVAFATLFYFVKTYQPIGSGWMEFATEVIPRLSLVAFIEIFAYFFLRLYRVGLSEVKAVYHELTTIDAKYAALETSISLGDAKSMRGILEEFAKIERHSVLQKGQTTVDLERARIEAKFDSALVGRLLELLGHKVNRVDDKVEK